jgi:hypothetical protein
VRATTAGGAEADQKGQARWRAASAPGRPRRGVRAMAAACGRGDGRRPGSGRMRLSFGIPSVSRPRYLPCRSNPWHRTPTSSRSGPAAPRVRHLSRPESDAAPSPGAWLPLRASHRSPWPSAPSSPVTTTAISGSGSRTRRPSAICARRPRKAGQDGRAAWWRRRPTAGRRCRPTRTRVPSGFPARTHEVIHARWARQRNAIAGDAFRGRFSPAGTGRKLSPPGAGRSNGVWAPVEIRSQNGPERTDVGSATARSGKSGAPAVCWTSVW